MKAALAILALFAATSVEATKLSREVYRRSYDNQNEPYSSLEQMDHDQEVQQATIAAELHEKEKAQQAKKRLADLEKRKQALVTAEEEKQNEIQRALAKKEELEHPYRAKKMYQIETTTFN